MWRFLRRLVDRRIPLLGREIEHLHYLRHRQRHTVPDGAPTVLTDRFQALGSIPGMLPYQHCVRLYCFAYGSAGVGGDIIEIGSWQGRSTCFLAQACHDTAVGVVHAVDHFRGNPGKEHHYVTGVADLSDLEELCRANITQVGLSDFVCLHAIDASDAVAEIRQTTSGARLLFIDGEHTSAAVRRDIEAYTPLVRPGGLIVFDDYSPAFGDYVAEVRRAVVDSGAFEAAVAYERTLVARKR